MVMSSCDLSVILSGLIYVVLVHIWSAQMITSMCVFVSVRPLMRVCRTGLFMQVVTVYTQE